ncbi:MAG: radical SAM protein, partial [Deltaproteobacteria bacterium]|nr:radical SAM protein [Deltaproteobacteria bacterium]
QCTNSEGSGRRFAVWVQGCLKGCEGCCNPHMLEIVPKMIVDWQAIESLIVSAARRFNIEGVTFLGGEPFLQASGLSRLAQSSRRAGLSVMVFTGYTWSELDELGLPCTGQLLRYTDVLVDGPFVRQLPETIRNWVGSTNQRFHYLTDFYRPDIETDPAYRGSVEIRVSASGNIRLNGMPGVLRLSS